MKKKFGLILINILMGSLLLSACIDAGSNPLDSTSWQLYKYRDESGELVPVAADTVVTALFQADKVSGIANCNNYNSSYQVIGSQLTFSPAATTRKMCADPLGIMKQEAAYLAALEQVQTFRLRGNTLEMRDSDGETLLIFTPAGQQDSREFEGKADTKPSDLAFKPLDSNERSLSPSAVLEYK